jgi:hypothetical protein
MAVIGQCCGNAGITYTMLEQCWSNAEAMMRQCWSNDEAMLNTENIHYLQLLSKNLPPPGHVDSASILETLHGGTDGSLQLDDPDPAIQGLGVDDDLHVQGIGFDEALDGFQIHPEVVGVEVLEFLDRLEVLQPLFRHLGDF